MSILSSIKNVASGIISGAKNALQGDFSNLEARAKTAAETVRSAASSAVASTASAFGKNTLPPKLSTASQQKLATNTQQKVVSTVRSSTSSKKKKKPKPTPPPAAYTSESGTSSRIQPSFSAPAVSMQGLRASGGLTFSDQLRTQPETAPAGMTARTPGIGGVGIGSSSVTQSEDNNDQTQDPRRLKTTQGQPLPLSAILAGIQSGGLTVNTNKPTLPRPNIPQTIPSDVLAITPSDVLARREQVANTAGAAGTMQGQLSYAQSLLDQYKAKQDQLTPTPEAPVEDTPEQQAFLDQFEPTQKIDVQQELDNYRDEIGLTDVTSSRIDIMKQLNATNEAYQQIFDDIKNNPELPKALAQRRLNEAYDQQKQLVLQLSGQYDLLLEQENILNDQLNQRYQILKDTKAEEQRKEDRLYTILNFMVDGGSIASLSDSELGTISDRLGIPLKALKDTRTQVLKEREDGKSKTTIYSTDQGLVAVTQDKAGKVLGTNVVLPKTGGSESGGFSTTALRDGASNAGMSIESFASLPADVKNLFINNADVGQLVVDDIASYQAGDLSYEDVVADLNSFGLAPEVKSYFTQTYLSSGATQQQQSGGMWSSLKSWFGF